MNKVILAVGILSASVALGQTNRATTTRSSSTTTSTSNYNNSNTGNYNTSNATMGTSTSGSMGTSGSMNTGTTGTYNNGTTSGTYGSGSMNSGTTGTYSSTSPTGTGSTYSTGSTGTTNSMNSDGTYNNSTTTTPSGSSNYNTMGTTGSATTPSASGSYNSNGMNGTTATSTSTYSTESSAASRRNGSVDDPAGANGYNNFQFGIYGGLNSTRFRGESIDAENPAGRLGYQLGLFLRGGGRLFGQAGAEYFASSSNYFRPGDGQSVQAINDQINIQYIQIPVYIGYKIVDSPRGNSSIRVQAGVAYANRINSNSNRFNLTNDEIRSGSFNALGQVGFDFGPFLIDLTYQHGLSDAIRETNFGTSQRRILTASVGFKF